MFVWRLFEKGRSNLKRRQFRGKFANLRRCVKNSRGIWSPHNKEFPNRPCPGQKAPSSPFKQERMNAKCLARTLGHKGAAVQIFRMNAHSLCGWMNRQFRTVSSQRTCAVCALHPKRISSCLFPSRRAHPFCMPSCPPCPLPLHPSVTVTFFSSVSLRSPSGENHSSLHSSPARCASLFLYPPAAVIFSPAFCSAPSEEGYPPCTMVLLPVPSSAPPLRRLCLFSDVSLYFSSEESHSPLHNDLDRHSLFSAASLCGGYIFLQRFASPPFGEAAPLCIAASSFTPSFSAVSPMRRLYLFSCVLLLIRERPFPFAQRFFSPLSFSRCIFLRRLHFSPAFRLAPIRRRPFPFSPFRCAAYHHVRIKWNRRFHGRHGFPLSPPPSLPAIRRLFLPFSGKHQYTNFGASRKGKAPKYTFSFTNRPAKQPRCTALARTFGVSPAAAAPASISNMSPS